MHATNMEGAEFVAYQLKDVVYKQYDAQEQYKGDYVESTRWYYFSRALLDSFSPKELVEAKAEEIVNIQQGRMTVKE